MIQIREKKPQNEFIIYVSVQRRTYILQFIRTRMAGPPAIFVRGKKTRERERDEKVYYTHLFYLRPAV